MPDMPGSHLTVTPLIVRPRDMDADRNVSNAVYFEYLHQSRLEHLARLGFRVMEATWLSGLRLSGKYM